MAKESLLYLMSKIATILSLAMHMMPTLRTRMDHRVESQGYVVQMVGIWL